MSSNLTVQSHPSFKANLYIHKDLVSLFSKGQLRSFNKYVSTIGDKSDKVVLTPIGKSLDENGVLAVVTKLSLKLKSKRNELKGAFNFIQLPSSAKLPSRSGDLKVESHWFAKNLSLSLDRLIARKSDRIEHLPASNLVKINKKVISQAPREMAIPENWGYLGFVHHRF